MSITLGKEVRDKITGYSGILVGEATYLFGCRQYGVVPKVDTDGKIRDTQWFDEGRVEEIGRGILPEEVMVKKNGGINRDEPKETYKLK